MTEGSTDVHLADRSKWLRFINGSAAGEFRPAPSQREFGPSPPSCVPQ